jgi:hypothetical protein
MYLLTLNSGCFLCSVGNFLEDHTLIPLQTKTLMLASKISIACDKIQRYSSLSHQARKM